MKKKMASFLNMKKICCSITCFSLLFATSCTALGLPEKDPAGKLRAYYQEGKDGKANDILIKHKLVAETSNISYPGVEIRTLPSQLEKGAFDDAKHTLYHVALFGQSSSYDYFPLLTLDLLSEKDWHFDTEDNIIAKYGDKVLFQLCYGSGKFATLIYSIKDDTLVELKDDSAFWPYHNHILTGNEDFIFADSISYAVDDYHTLHWYDWNGNIIKTIDNARAFFYNNDFYYSVCSESDGLKQFDFYSADYDASNEKLIGTIQEGHENSNITCYFDESETAVIECSWNDVNGNSHKKSIPFAEFNGTTICK